MPSVPCGSRTALVAGLLYAGALLPGCVRTVEYQIGQRVDMGPYTFSVVGTEQGKWGSVDTIDVLFHLDRDDTAPFTTDFTESFAFKMELVDAAGNAFPVNPQPLAPLSRGGRQRSDRYRAEVRLSASHEGVRDATRIGKSPADFRLIIDNPAAEGDQPRRVAIQLQ